MQKKAGRGADRISALPTAALHRILSFLTTKEAAQTSLLSRRWRRLWTTAPTLRFGIAEFFECGEPPQSSWQRLIKAAAMVAASRDASTLERLELLLTLPLFLMDTSPSAGENTSTILNMLVSFAAARNVREASLVFFACSGFQLPRSLCTSDSLGLLELEAGHAVLSVPSTSRLPNLKTLRLRSVVFQDDSLQRLLAACPALEDLDLQHVLFHSLHVTGRALKTLAVRSFGYSNCKFLVSAPNLRSIHYAPLYSNMDCVLRNLDSVADVVLDISRIDDTPCIGIPIGELLKAVYNVKILTLSFWSGPDEGLLGQQLSPEQELWNRLPSFQNLRHLKLCIWFTYGHIEAIIYILKHCPNVESLVIESVGPQRRRFGRSEIDRKNWTPQKEDSMLVWHHLKSIEIQDFESSANELEFVRYLLMATKGALERMVITPFKRAVGL